MRAKVSREPFTMPKATKRSILTAAFAALALVTGSAGFAADAQRGKQFAGRVCAVCHVVFKGQSPGDPNAPSFRSIAKSRQFHKKGIAWLWEKHQNAESRDDPAGIRRRRCLYQITRQIAVDWQSAADVLDFRSVPTGPFPCRANNCLF